MRDASGNLWQPGAGGLCLHTIVLDPRDPERIFVAISAAGVFRTDDEGRHWTNISTGLSSNAMIVLSVAYSPLDDALYAGTSDGVYMRAHMGLSGAKPKT